MPGIAAGIAKAGHNVVILVPSFAAATPWEKAGAKEPSGNNFPTF